MMESTPRSTSRSRFAVLAVVLFLAVAALFSQFISPRVQAVSTTIVISQVYGGGGNTGATYKNDFIELFNRGNAPVSLSGWSVQYAATTGTSWQKTDLTSVTLQPGQYYLIQEQAGAGGTTNLPTPDAIGAGSGIAMAAGAGKVALLNNQTLITSGTACPGGASVIDLVGYGSGTNCSEGAPTATLTNTTAALRAASGCTDTDSNSSDFATGAASPRNTASTTHPCSTGFSLTVMTAGSGAGSVSSSPAGITCPSTCSASYTTGTSVTLTPTAAGGSTFTSWSGCDSTSGNTCTVVMTAAKSVTATFTAVQQTLNVTKNGTGGGTVTSSPAGINCGPTCSATYSNGASVTLTGTPDGTSTFTSWSGCDTTSGNTCTVAMNTTRNVTATFTTTQRVLTVNRTGTGTGTVTSSPSGINCGSTCAANYANNTAVTLTAAADLSSTFGGWTGCDSTAGNICNVTMTSNKTVSAAFTFVPTPAGAVVISQIYGGGGNAGATYKNDFIELFNRSANAVDLTGWSVQYNSNTGTGAWSGKTTLSGIIPAGGYYLVQEAAGSGGTQNLPTPDATGGISMALGAGKVALVINSTTLNDCPSGSNIIDLVGYGSTANCSEGSNPTPTLGNTIAAIRTHGGCKDTDNNGLDFKTGPPSPRNSSTPLHACPAGDLEPEVFSNTPTDGATSIPLASNITVQFDEPVNVSGVWYSISCAISGAHTATVSGGPTTFTINPDIDFATLEQCTVTIYASGVTDQDSIDPPDNMAADYTWTFLTGHDPQVNLTMGNPSNATADVGNENNYLMEKDQYALSYNRSKATSNWVSWQLDQTWLGSTPRQDTFRADDTLPMDWYHVLETDYQFGTYGFDRGHMCPSADRTATIADNTNTFLMTNMVPQASGNNQGPWGSLENYLRSLIGGGANRIYIISGPAGQGGNSSTGSFNTITTPGGGAITVPAWTWKVALVLPVGDNDVSRVNSSTRTIAVIMPNNDNIRPDTWQKYLATVRQVESLSGYNFYSNVPTSIQDVIEPKLDVANDTAPQVINQTATTDEDNAVTFTLTATDFNINNVLSFSAASGPAHGSLQFGMPNCPANLTQAQCTVSVTYTPAGNYNGPDSFTFTANDGALDSNAATVNLTVNAVNDPPIANNQSVTTDSNTPVSITLTGSDVETAPANLVFAVTSGTGNGALSGTAPNLVYTPGTNFCGSDNLRFTVRDTGDGSSGPLTSSEGTVSIIVRDRIPPTITTPADMTVIAAPGADSAVVNFTVSASDSCGGVNVQNTPASGSVFPLGVTTVHITATDDAGNTSTSSFNITVKATSSVTINCPPGVTYNGSVLEPCTATVTGAGGLSQSLAISYANNVNSGTARASASYAGDPTHEGSSGSATFEITRAASTTLVNCPAGETYSGSALEPCTAVVTGAGGLNQSLPVSYNDNRNAGTASANASYAGDANHDGSSGSGGFAIAKASSTTTVNCPASQTYTGSALEPCTASYSGAGGLSGTLTPTYSNNIDAGSATTKATYGGDANHEGSTGNAGFTISKASSSTTLNCPASETYTGAAIEPCTATATGAGGLNQSVSPVTYTNNLNAGSATAAATYAGDANHDSSTGNGGFTIAKASSTTTVNCPASQTYTGAAIEPCTASVTGTGGLNQSVSVTYTNNVNAGTATANAAFGGDANHEGSSGSATFTITKATPVITWSNPADIVYGTALGSTQLNATANVPGGFSYTPGSGTVLNAAAAQPLLASFSPTDTANYNATSKNVQINVLKATASFSNLSSPTIAYGTATTNLAGKISFGSFIPTGNVAITLNGVTQNAAIGAGGNFASSFATGSLPPVDPPYTITYSYAGDGNFNSGNGSGTLTVGYSVLPLFDQTAVHQSGSTIPIKIEITNSSGANISSANLTVTAIGVSLISTSVYGPIEDSGNSNPDLNFRLAGDSYIFNLKTTGLSTGTYNLYFKVGADPTVHAVQFQVR